MSDDWKPRPHAPHEPPPKARFVIHFHGHEVPGARFKTAAEAWAFIDAHSYAHQTVWDTQTSQYAPRPANPHDKTGP